MHVTHFSVAQETLKVEVEKQVQQCLLFTQAWDISKNLFNLFLSYVVVCRLYLREELQWDLIFLVLQREQTLFQNGLSYLSLENILQCKHSF